MRGKDKMGEGFKSSSISFPESSFPLTSGSGYERLWDNPFSNNKILVMNTVAQALA